MAEDGALNRAVTWSLTCLLVVPALTLLMRGLNRAHIVGKEHLAGMRGPFLFVSNHVTILDDGFVDPLIFSPRCYRGYRFIPFHVPEERNFFKGPVMSWFMRRMKCIPIRRGEGLFQPAMDRIMEALRHGECVRVFPEGTRTRSGRLGPGRAGVGRVLYETGVPVVPCFHRGLEGVLPIGCVVPRVGRRVEVLIGPPFGIEELRALPNTRETWQKIADRVMEKIAELAREVRAA
ncbi:MAG TPA: lysophospholipid acyltransferase family protein [Methylomirabilota bacterium]|nr:lysophospholipid acyltransferase family protein [Methylomirabilota bacterium]